MLIKQGIGYDEDFQNQGVTARLVHGTTTNAFGSLSRIRDPDGKFDERYDVFKRAARLHPGSQLVMPRVCHSANVGLVNRVPSREQVIYADINCSHLSELNIFKCITPPGMDSGDQSIGFDALVTNSRNLFLGLAHADCAPVFIFFPRESVMALVHVGVLGYLSGILENTYQCIEDWFELNPITSKVYIGPCISRTEYNIRKSGMWEPLLSELMSEGEADAFDLRNAIIDQLCDLGVRKPYIQSSEYCTGARTDLFYSNSKATPEQKPTLGRNLSYIGTLPS